ncbi:hypothetical protein Dimus_005424, partial [Dionaea muscipula]
KKYHLDESIEGSLRAAFEKVAQTRLKDLLGVARKDFEKEGRPYWIGKSVWERLRAFWMADETFIKRRATNKANRGEQKEGLRPSSHIGGSWSFVEYKRKKINNFTNL